MKKKPKFSPGIHNGTVCRVYQRGNTTFKIVPTPNGFLGIVRIDRGFAVDLDAKGGFGSTEEAIAWGLANGYLS